MIPGGAEWIIIGGVVLVLFGASAIPRFARSIGRAKKEFEKGQRDGARQAADDSRYVILSPVHVVSPSGRGARPF